MPEQIKNKHGFLEHNLHVVWIVNAGEVTTHTASYIPKILEYRAETKLSLNMDYLVSERWNVSGSVYHLPRT
jgi:hypothetical protein